MFFLNNCNYFVGNTKACICVPKAPHFFLLIPRGNRCGMLLTRIIRNVKSYTDVTL